MVILIANQITVKVMATIDISGEFDDWIGTDKAKERLTAIFREVVRDELNALLKEDLVDTKEAAEILGLSPSALRKRVERGQLAVIRIGSSLRFRRSDLLRR